MPLGESLAVNNNPGVTGQSYEYTVENQFIEVTNKWDSAGDYYYFHQLPTALTQITILDNDKNAVDATVMLEGSRLYHSLDGAVYWVRYFADDRFHEDLLTYQPVMRKVQANRHDGSAPFVAEGTFGWRTASLTCRVGTSTGFALPKTIAIGFWTLTRACRTTRGIRASGLMSTRRRRNGHGCSSRRCGLT